MECSRNDAAAGSFADLSWEIYRETPEFSDRLFLILQVA